MNEWLRVTLLVLGCLTLLLWVRFFFTHNARRANYNAYELKRLTDLQGKNRREARRITDKKERKEALTSLVFLYPPQTRFEKIYMTPYPLFVGVLLTVLPWSEGGGWRGAVLALSTVVLGVVGVLCETIPKLDVHSRK